MLTSSPTRGRAAAAAAAAARARRLLLAPLLLLLCLAPPSLGVEVPLPSWAQALAARLAGTDPGRLTPQGFVRLREELIRDVLAWGARELPDAAFTGGSRRLEYPYFAFLPQFEGRLPTAGSEAGDPTAAVNVTNACFTHTCFRFLPSPLHPDGSRGEVVIDAEGGPATPLCSDLYLLATASGFRLELVRSRGRHVVPWALPEDASRADEWDQAAKGVRVFRFATSLLETLQSVYQTVLLFEPVLTQEVSPRAAARNTQFLRDYAGYDFQLLANASLLSSPPEEGEIRSGDMFGVIRMDGLDPMLAWGMGATTGHVTTALWMEDGELYVVESQIQSSYWPQGNVQRTPYRTWLEWARAAGYNVMYMPLSKEAAGRYDERAARAWFEEVEGLAYGFHSMLWGWVDTLRDNYPCLPPDYGRCLEWEFLEVAFALIDRSLPAVARLLWNEAFNLRVGREGLSTSEVWMVAQQDFGLPAQAVPTLVEQDAWLYHTWKGEHKALALGRSMVCCVFVCGMWKAAGVFGPNIDPSSINCGEFTNADDAMLAVFDAGRARQILGQYRMFFPGFNSKQPFPHMDESCPSLGPAYERPMDC